MFNAIHSQYRKHRMEDIDGTFLTENMYNAVIGLTVLFGILINVVTACFVTPYMKQIDMRFALLGYLVVSIGCMTLVMKARRAVFSFIGFTGLAASMGFLLTFFITGYTTSSVYTAFITTGIVVAAMMIVSTIFPSFFLSIGRTLLFSLVSCIVIQFVGGLIFGLNLGVLDYVMVVFFAGMIGFDWARAQAYPRTLENAIDSSADIYVDLVNIFVYVLSIIGRKR